MLRLPLLRRERTRGLEPKFWGGHISSSVCLDSSLLFNLIIKI